MSKTTGTRFRGEKKTCLCCGMEFLAENGNQKYCEKCRKYDSSRRKKVKNRAEMGSADPFRPYIKCLRCGEVVLKTSGNQRFCRECGRINNIEHAKASYRRRKEQTPPEPKPMPEEVPLARSKTREREETLLNYHDLSGKSADRISAEAAAFGFGASYGKYVACVESGMIDRWLRDKGITDPVAVLREIKTK